MSEQRFDIIEITIRLRPIDPSVDPDGRAMEITRDAINSTAAAPARSEQAPESIPEPPEQDDRTRKIESELTGLLEKPLRDSAQQIAREKQAIEAQPGVTAYAKLAKLMERNRHDARMMLEGAVRLLHSTWKRCWHTTKQVAGTITPKVIADILYRVLKDHHWP